MTPEIQQSPFSGHDILYCSPLVKNPHEAKIILMGEWHGLENHERANIELIKRLGGEKICLFLEGIRSMHSILLAQTAYEKRYSALSVRCFGWDGYHHMARDGSVSTADQIPHPQILEPHDWLDPKTKQTEEMIADDFPRRTAALVATLQKINDLTFDRAFFHGGKDHFIEELNNCDPRLSLKTLYAVLENLPAVVVFPKRV